MMARSTKSNGIQQLDIERLLQHVKLPTGHFTFAFLKNIPHPSNVVSLKNFCDDARTAGVSMFPTRSTVTKKIDLYERKIGRNRARYCPSSIAEWESRSISAVTQKTSPPLKRGKCECCSASGPAVEAALTPGMPNKSAGLIATALLPSPGSLGCCCLFAQLTGGLRLCAKAS